jgi:integrase
MPKLPRGMVKKRGRYYLRERRGGREQWIALGADHSEAKDRYKRLKGLGLRGDRRITVEQFSKRWLREYVPVKRKSYQASQLAEQRMRDHVLPVLGRKLLVEVTPADIRGLCHALEAKKRLASRTVVHVLSDVRCMFNYAAQEVGLIERSPFRGKLMPVLQDEPPDPFLDHEVDVILEMTPPQHQSLVRLALLSGLRYGELRGLRWNDLVGGERPHLIVRRSHDGPTKSRKTRAVPLTVEAVAILRELPRSSVFVFPGRFGGMRARDASSLSRVLKRHVSRYRFHRLRHTLATRFLEAGGTSDMLRLILGHSTVKLTERYGRIADLVVWTEMRSLDLKLSKTGDVTGDIAPALHAREAGKS